MKMWNDYIISNEYMAHKYNNNNVLSIQQNDSITGQFNK